jgi:hypothetical protein
MRQPCYHRTWIAQLAPVPGSGLPREAPSGAEYELISSPEGRILMPPSSVHFNGSVNLPDAETVMREISSRIPAGVRRMTDGETGERNYWIHFQVAKFAAMPELELVGTREAYDTGDAPAPAMPQLRLVEGVAPEAVNWPELGYADAYRESYEVFRALQEEGTIPAGVRFQIQYPTPIAPIAGTVVAEDLPNLAGSYERALFADLGKALANIPHERCAVQWDVAVEFGLLEGGFDPGRPAPLNEIAAGLTRCVDQVPDDVPVGMHLCYGDYGHQHFKQPDSLELQVRLVNAVLAGSSRPVDWFSFTVPQARRDPDYFAPLRNLQAGPETELDFALVPYYPADQPQGTTAEQARLIDAYLAESPSGSRDWGICTECGMGRVAAEDVPTLLELHREILDSGGVR